LRSCLFVDEELVFYLVDSLRFTFFFFFSSRRRHTRSVSAFLLNRSSDLVFPDIFHGIDKAVADTWNNFWKDGKADGIGSNLSRRSEERRVGKECRSRWSPDH